MSKVKFLSAESGDFSHVLKQRVDAYFQTNNLSKNANTEMVLKTAFYLGSYVGTYFLIVFGHFSLGTNLLLVILMGLLTSGIGFNIGHDAIHGAYSKWPWLNQVLGHTFSMMGASVFTWKTMHNIVHHSYTNIPGADGDLDPVRWLKFAETGGKRTYHRFQYLYALPLYSLTSLVWVFVKDFKYIGRKTHLAYEKPLTPRSEYFKLYAAKTAYYIAFIALPLILMPFAWWQILCGFIIMHLVAGFTLALTFQLGHLVEGTEFSDLTESGLVKEKWCELQLKGSANFSPRSFWASWMFGGLNYQIEHHLFPKVCHVHYRYLAPIVKETAQEFNLPYTQYPTFLSALRSHLSYLKMTGRAS